MWTFSWTHPLCNWMLSGFCQMTEGISEIYRRWFHFKPQPTWVVALVKSWFRWEKPAQNTAGYTFSSNSSISHSTPVHFPVCFKSLKCQHTPEVWTHGIVSNVVCNCWILVYHNSPVTHISLQFGPRALESKCSISRESGKYAPPSSRHYCKQFLKAHQRICPVPESIILLSNLLEPRY